MSNEHKIDLSLVPPELETEVAVVMARGNRQAGRRPHDWKLKAPDMFFRALLRHVNAMRRHGVYSIDSESGCPHLAHVAANAAMLLYFMLTSKREITK